MTRKEAAGVIKFEKACVLRQDTPRCNRDCKKCDLLLPTEDVLTAYDMAIKALGQCLDEVPTVNAIVIPNNATNGDVIKALFPDVKIHQSGGYTGCLFRPSVMLDDIRSEWWNAPYKAESEVKKNEEENNSDDICIGAVCKYVRMQ